MHLKAHPTRYRMNTGLSGRIEGVLEIWASKNGNEIPKNNNKYVWGEKNKDNLLAKIKFSSYFKRP